MEHLPRINSDHSPLLISLEDNKKHKNDFLFQAAWLSHPYFQDLNVNNWKNNQSAVDNVKETAAVLRDWIKNTFGNIFNRKRKLSARLVGIQKAMTANNHRGLIKLEHKIRKELEAVLYQEEIFWFQKAREEWICSGDRNTSFYHTATNAKKTKRKIGQLQNNQGTWCNEENDIKHIIRDYFVDIFTKDQDEIVLHENLISFPMLNNIEWDEVNKDFMPEDIKEALFDMAPLKAPGPDRFHAGFYQRVWGTVGETIINQALDFFTSGQIPHELNDTWLALITKVSFPERANQFRPIGLCNVLYKVLTKAMSNRIKGVMRGLIGAEQSSFIPDRQITDNIVVYQEVMHSMRKIKGNTGFMAIKIDLEKAYDRLSWAFIDDTLKAAGFNNVWRRNIMACISTTRLGILWNGDRMDWITPSRGIRQGDPISPYIFVLCIERLSHIIRGAIAQGKWKGIKLHRYGLTLSHFLFADDMVLFAEASEEQISVIKECLDSFCNASGQRVNYNKSHILFSSNVPSVRAEVISNSIGIQQTNDLGRYLGVQTIHGRTTSSHFTHLLEKIDARLEGWKTRHLSLAGRRVMAQSVLASIPYYTMQSTYLPKSICDEIDKKIRHFIWGSREGERKMHLINWEKVTLTRDK